MSIPLPLRIQGLRRPFEEALHLQLAGLDFHVHLLMLMTKPMAGIYRLSDRPFKGFQPHGSQGPWRHRLLARTLVGLRQAPGLWELKLEDGQVLALNWRRKQAGLRLRRDSVLGGPWFDHLPLETTFCPDELEESRKAERIHLWRVATRRRLQKQINDLLRRKADDPDQLRQWAQRMSSLRHQVRQEATLFWLPQYDSMDSLDRVDRRPGEGIQQRIDRFYKEAGRQERRLIHQRERLDHLKSRLVSIEEEEPPEPIENRVKKAAVKPLEKGIRRYRLPSGREVLAGRDAKANHRLTFGLGRGRDLWFHRRNGPGPHVILRRAKDEEVPEEDLLLAASLALRLGARGTEAQEEVRWTERRYLDPVPGQPGKVLVRKERVLLVDSDLHKEVIEGLFNR
ncbi:MAG TPA: hypothetical protein DEB46_07050 [Myxococcales bacterium]|nr:hypothetical protein [Myxococcales bacterium]HBU48054.1 hypothetical protein [Myxococcales bacterium]